MEVFLVYLWLKLDLFIGFLWGGAVIAGFWRVVCALNKHDNVNYSWKEFYRRPDAYDVQYKHRWKYCWHVIVICLTLALTLPTANQAAALVGTHYAVQLASSPEGQKVQSLIRKKANEYLDEQLKPKSKE